MNITKLKKEFNKKFVEPIDTKMRCMNLNNEAGVMGTEEEVWDWIEKAFKEIRQESYEQGYDTGYMIKKNLRKI